MRHFLAFAAIAALLLAGCVSVSDTVTQNAHAT